MRLDAGGTSFHHAAHGSGTAVVVLHGAGVDHRETEACFEPAFAGETGYRRIYPDLPGMGRTPAHEALRSADDVVEALVAFVAAAAPGAPYLLVGHSAGAYYAQALAARAPDRVAGLALVCPLTAHVREVPEHRAVVGSGELGDEGFRSYFVVQTPELLERYERVVAPGAALVDEAALERIGERWEITPTPGPPYDGPTLVVAGRRDSVVGHAAAVDLAEHYPHATLAVLDDAGHALPHEQPDVLRALVGAWLRSVRRAPPTAPTGRR